MGSQSLREAPWRWATVSLVATLMTVGVACSSTADEDEDRTFAAGSQNDSTCQGPNAAMEYVNVCGPDRSGAQTCKCISRLVMGTDHLGSLWQQNGFPEASGAMSSEQRRNNARAMLDYAVEKGVTLFDTSPIYVDNIENTLGEWVRDKKAANRNAPLYVLTKGGFPYDNGPGTYDSRLHGSSRKIVENVADELRWSYPHLQGNIDFYLMHRDDIKFDNYVDRTYRDQSGNVREQTPVGTILGALSDRNVYGDIPNLGGFSIRDHYTWIGVSNWTTPRVNDAVRVAEADSKLLKPMINSPYFSLFEMAVPNTIHSGGVEATHDEMMDPNFQKGIRIMPYSPLGGFPIIDKGTRENDGADAWVNAKDVARNLRDMRERYWGHVYDAIFSADNERRFYRVHAVSRRFALDGRLYTIDQWLNAYVLAHPRVDMLAVGPIKREHLDRTAEALKLARALRNRRDLLDWLHHGRIEDLATLKPLSDGNVQRTVILLYGPTQPGQDMFLRGGIDHGVARDRLGRNCTDQNMLCAMPIGHRSIVKDALHFGDRFLDWYGSEPGQGSAAGSPAAWTTNRWPDQWGPKKTVARDGYGETPLNTYGDHYWMLDVDMDCSRGVGGWFEFKSFISNGPGWEGNMSQVGAPYPSQNHVAQCGRLNVFRRNESPPVEIKPIPQ